jgi:excisionase family DNA binding protein
MSKDLVKHWLSLSMCCLAKFWKCGKHDLDIMKKVIQEEFLTRFQVAEMLKCSLITVDRYIKKNVIPSFRIGGLRRFAKSDILNFQKKMKSKKKDSEV